MGHLLVDEILAVILCLILVVIFLSAETVTTQDTKDKVTRRPNSRGNRGVPVNVNNQATHLSLIHNFDLSFDHTKHSHSSKPSPIATYQCGGFHERRPLVVVSSMNGIVTALDLSSNGRKQWDLDAGTGPLLSSSLSQKDGEFLDGEKRILPSLDGDLFTWDGSHLEACPFSTDSLISSSFKLSDDVLVVGSKTTRTYGINAHTGKLVYSCTPEECSRFGPQPEDNEDVIVTKFQQHVVRALDQRSGIEKWNYSVGQHDVKYINGHTPADEGVFCRNPKEDMVPGETIHLRISMEYNMVFGVKESNHRDIVWSHEFSSDIANVWTIIDGEVKALDILSLDIDPSISQEHILIPYADPIMPSFIGRFEDQLYVRPSRTQAQLIEESTTPATVEYVADGTGYGLVPRIRWRPYLSSADSRTPILSHSGKPRTDDVGFVGPIEKPGDAAEWSQYPFDAGYSLPWLPSKCPKTDLSRRHPNKPKTTLSDNESFQSNEYGIHILLGMSVWTWWREMLISSIIMAIGWQLLYQFIFKSACDVSVDNAQSEVGIAEEAMTIELVQDSNKQFKSRYLSDFNHQECLGKGGFGIVFQAQNKVDESSYAIKRISLPHRKEAREKVLREARALARLEHLGIVRYFQSWIEEPPPGWQDQHDQILMGDSSLNEPLSTIATFNKDSQLLRDEKRFLRQTSNDNSNGMFGSSGSGIKKEHTWSHDEDESGSFSIVFKSESTSPKKIIKTLDQFDVDEPSFSENDFPASVPFQRYSVMKENSDSFDIVFEDSGCSSKNKIEDTGQSVRSDPSLHKDSGDSRTAEKPSNKESQSAISEILKESDSLKPNIYLYIQMQLCQKETLKDWLVQSTDNRDRNKVLHIFQQILGAVNYVHQCGMIHRDLKPSNIFFSMDGSVKIGDFGLVTAMDTELEAEAQSEIFDSGGNHHTSQVGTQLYMSPEQVNGHSYDLKVDIFSLGLILFELLYPFSTQMERVSVLFRAKNDLNFPPKFLEDMPVENELVQWMLCREPSSRPSTDEVIDCASFKDLYEKFTPPLERSRSRYSSSF